MRAAVARRSWRRPAPAAQEVVRLRVVAALESGYVRTYRQAAEVFGVSERSVGTLAAQVQGRRQGDARDAGQDSTRLAWDVINGLSVGRREITGAGIGVVSGVRGEASGVVYR
ncbi:hypothetical protein FNH09_17005 [Streptomyces adustus]|uniref:Uncharacterized protein n=1 Tax=Streptomyces adustus TaxID=1609272 RepID=A0A5N8VE14_9ACTN|nr:hypothetical protein [Streptomyces adustus]MPY32902.1 hypothetical protein [Streptomyces adustus]